MSTYDDASLVLVPSGYKNGVVFSQKPMDANGQLTFTRASSATRVDSNGLIEKVRTNLVLQSNSFDTTWTLSSSTTLTSGQAGYDGTNNAWLLKRSDTSARFVSQNITQAASTYTFSVYAKAETVNWLYIYSSDGTNTSTAYFDLANGALGTTAGAITSKIESVGGGWYRCSVSYSDDITSVRIYPAVANGSITGGISPAGVFIQNAQLEVGDIATQYLATTTAAVSVGPVSGLPRLDYLGSTCPRLLLEPQRTNLALQSEQMNNAYWSTLDATVSANAFTSPTGENSADAIVGSGTGTIVRLSSTIISGTLSASHTASCFLKKGTNNFALFQASVTGATGVTFAYVDLVNGTSPQSGVTIQDYGNDWYRVSFTFTLGATFANIILRIFPTLSTTTTAFATNADALNKSVLAWGCQLEASSAYATSYIPTLGASVTRVADACSKTGISSLIGQTEGTLFAEFEINATNTDGLNRILSVTDGTGNNRVLILAGTSETFRFIVTSAGSSIINFISSTSVLGGRHKVAFAYKASEYAAYVDGVQLLTDTSSVVPTTLNSVFVGCNESTLAPIEGTISQALLFKTRLDNATLQSLTTL